MFYVGIPNLKMCQTKSEIKQSCYYHALFKKKFTIEHNTLIVMTYF